jgi:hypothetical protein
MRANIVRLLLLTGARKTEVLSLRWEHLELGVGVWTKPSAHTKQKATHRVPLSAPAMLLLSELRAKAADDAEFIFPGRSGGHRVEFKRAWAELCKASGIAAARIHDLRYTYASVLASAGQSLPIIGALFVAARSSAADVTQLGHHGSVSVRWSTLRVCCVDYGTPALHYLRMRPFGIVGNTAVTVLLSVVSPGPSLSDMATASAPSITVKTSADDKNVHQGTALTISWQSKNAPQGAGVALFLQKALTGHIFDPVATSLPTSGIYVWKVPVFVVQPIQCARDPTGGCVGSINAGAEYKIVARLYTPRNASFVEHGPAQTHPNYLASSDSGVFMMLEAPQ